MSKVIVYIIICIVCAACSLRPGSLRKLENKVAIHSTNFSSSLEPNRGRRMQALYLGCGGVYLVNNDIGLLIDPFFSNQPAFRIGKSVLLGKDGKRKLRPDKKALSNGLAAVRRLEDETKVIPTAIMNAHSHYDHLMDIPAIYQHYDRKPQLLLTSSGFNICHQVIDTSNVIILENHITGSTAVESPIILRKGNKALHIYPILSEHNPHYRNLKFFSGEQTRPLSELKDPFQKTKANLWLEGNTFSFLIDYIDDGGAIDFRVFLQSSSCNAPSGIPPRELLEKKPIDLALIGLASYSYSPNYPCELLQAISPGQIMWIHWEDFFRKYSKPPKTLRGTDVPAFFKMPCLVPYKKSGKLLWPRVKMELVY